MSLYVLMGYLDYGVIFTTGARTEARGLDLQKSLLEYRRCFALMSAHAASHDAVRNMPGYLRVLYLCFMESLALKSCFPPARQQFVAA